MSSSAGIDLSELEQLIKLGQTRTIIAGLMYIVRLQRPLTLVQTLEHLGDMYKKRALDAVVDRYTNGDLVGTRRFEIAAVLSRIGALATSQG